MPLVSVAVVNYQGGPWLVGCLRGLACQTCGDFEAWIVDNGSTDGSVEAAAAAVAGDPRFHFDFAGENLGFAAASNRAAGKASGDWLAMLNPDAIPDPDWLEQLLSAVGRHPGVVMFGSTQIDAADPGRLDGCGDHYFFAGLPWRGGFGWPVDALPAEDRGVFSPCAAAALYRRDSFAAVGGFDESFFCYLEDVDLGFRLRLAGGACIQVAAARVRHVGGGTSSHLGDFTRFHGTRNLVWCFVKNMPGPLFWLLAPLHAAAMTMLWAKAVLRGDGRTVARALRAAVAGIPWRSRRAVQANRRVSWWTIARSLTWSPWLYLWRAPTRLSGTDCARGDFRSPRCAPRRSEPSRDRFPPVRSPDGGPGR